MALNQYYNFNFPWLFLKWQVSLTQHKIPWHFPDVEDFFPLSISWPVATMDMLIITSLTKPILLQFARIYFLALGTSYTCLLQVLIGSFCCSSLLWLTRLITVDLQYNKPFDNKVPSTRNNILHPDSQSYSNMYGTEHNFPVLGNSFYWGYTVLVLDFQPITKW